MFFLLNKIKQNKTPKNTFDISSEVMVEISILVWCVLYVFFNNNQALSRGYEMDCDWSTQELSFLQKLDWPPPVDMFNNEMNPCISHKPISIKAAITITTVTQRNLLLLDFYRQVTKNVN